MSEIKYKEDYDLVHRYLLGDTDAGYILYSGIFNFVKSYVYKTTSLDIFDDSDREDILNEIFKLSIEKLDRYNGTSKFSTFVLGIAKLKIKEKLRCKNKQNETEYKLDDTIAFHSKDPLAILIEREKKTAIINAINSLSDNHKQVLQLRFNGMTSRQIAVLTGKSEDAIDSMYRRALKALKKNFEKIYN